MPDAQFLIWSIEHEAWWQPERRGYARELGAAGRYPEAEARAIVEQCNRARVNECLVPATAVDINASGQRDQLYAWLGEDEFGSGRIGLKQGLTAVGMIPLVVVADDLQKVTTAPLVAQLQRQADRFNKTIYLARFLEIDEAMVLRPRPQG